MNHFFYVQASIKNFFWEQKLSIQDKLMVTHRLTWGKKYRDGAGKLKKSDQEFTGWDANLAAQKLGVSDTHLDFNKHILNLSFNPKIVGQVDVTVDKVKTANGRYAALLRLRKPLCDYSYFLYPEPLLYDRDLTVAEKVGLLVAWMLVDKDNKIVLRADQNYVSALKECLGVSDRQARRIKSRLIAERYLGKLSDGEFAGCLCVLPHKSYRSLWKQLTDQELPDDVVRDGPKILDLETERQRLNPEVVQVEEDSTLNRLLTSIRKPASAVVH